jgi:hypothetical protein
LVTRTTTPRKRTSVAAKKPVAAKSVIQRAPSAVATKPVANLVDKGLKPAVAKKVAVARKPKPASPPNPSQPVATKSNVKTTGKKQKLVRASFSLPADEHASLADLKMRAKKLGKAIKKSEILRAGIAHLVAMADTALVTALAKVERIKTGRPTKKSKKK